MKRFDEWRKLPTRLNTHPVEVDEQSTRQRRSRLGSHRSLVRSTLGSHRRGGS